MINGQEQQAAILRATREWRQTLDALRDAVGLLDANGLVLRCNRAMQRLLNLPFDQITGRSCWKLVYGRDTPPQPYDLASLATHHTDIRMNMFTWQLDERWYEITLDPITDDTGRIVGAIHVMADISDIKGAERAIQQYAERLRMLHQIDQAVLEFQRPEKLAQEVLRRLGRLAPFLVGSVTLFDFPRHQALLYAVANAHIEKTEGGRLPLDSAWVEQLRNGKPCAVPDLRLLLAPSRWEQTAGSLGIGFSTAVPLRAGGKLIGSLNLGLATEADLTPERTEITTQVAVSLAVALQNSQLFQSVNEQRRMLRRLGLRMTAAEEEQRRRLARELHDRVGQILTAIGINLNYARGMLRDQPPALLARIDESLSQIEAVSDRIRDVMSELRPMVLDDFGLPGALQWYADQFSRRTGVAVSIHEEPALPRLSHDVETALFRIAEEAFTNISKHAQARHVSITFGCSAAAFTMQIADDGLGFDVRTKVERPRKGGWGLMTMKERAMGAGASLRVESHPKAGTTIVVQVERAKEKAT